MKTLSRNQKIILIILAVMDFAVIGGLAAVVITTMMRPAAPPPPPPTPTAAPTRIEKPLWTPTATTTPKPTLPAQPTRTRTPTLTPRPTVTPAPTSTSAPTPTPAPIVLNNGSFDMLMTNRIPGWKWDAYVNYRPGQQASVEDSYAEPFFSSADDPVRQIEGTTLKIETMRWLKYRAWIHQTLTITAGSKLYFQIKANAYSSLDRITVKAGIDPTGAGNCYDAQWGEERRINQDDGIVTLKSPTIVVPPVKDAAAPPTPTPEHGEGTPTATETPAPAVGRITVCFFAEPTYPHINNAAFFDEAEIILR